MCPNEAVNPKTRKTLNEVCRHYGYNKSDLDEISGRAVSFSNLIVKKLVGSYVFEKLTYDQIGRAFERSLDYSGHGDLGYSSENNVNGIRHSTINFACVVFFLLRHIPKERIELRQDAIRLIDILCQLAINVALPNVTNCHWVKYVRDNVEQDYKQVRSVMECLVASIALAEVRTIESGEAFRETHSKSRKSKEIILVSRYSTLVKAFLLGYGKSSHDLDVYVYDDQLREQKFVSRYNRDFSQYDHINFMAIDNLSELKNTKFDKIIIGCNAIGYRSDDGVELCGGSDLRAIKGLRETQSLDLVVVGAVHKIWPAKLYEKNLPVDRSCYDNYDLYILRSSEFDWLITEVGGYCPSNGDNSFYKSATKINNLETFGLAICHEKMNFIESFDADEKILKIDNTLTKILGNDDNPLEIFREFQPSIDEISVRDGKSSEYPFMEKNDSTSDSNRILPGINDKERSQKIIEMVYQYQFNRDIATSNNPVTFVKDIIDRIFLEMRYYFSPEWKRLEMRLDPNFREKSKKIERMDNKKRKIAIKSREEIFQQLKSATS